MTTEKTNGTTATGPAVYRCIAAVSRELAKVGISKDRKNEQQGYKFRGIDEVLNALAPVLATQGLVILPRMLSRELTERQTAKGGVLFSVVVCAEFTFVAAEDGSAHTVVTFGEAMDSGDKATNKAMSAAYKYAAFLAFCIPLEGMAADADTVTPPEVVATVPDGYADWLIDLEVTASTGRDALVEAWKQSKPEYREHLTRTAPDTIAALRKRAAAVKPATGPVAVPA